MKVCSRCKKEKDSSEFSKGQNKCKECYKELHKDYYNRNKDFYTKKQRELRAKRIDLIQEYKASRGCEKCGEKHPSCLQFHHIGDKEKGIHDAIRAGWSLERVFKEIDKCMILCANCHFKLHWKDYRRI